MKKRDSKYNYNWYFGQTVEYLRKCAGISQKEFAAKLRLNQSAISRIENGAQSVRVQDLASFASQFGLLAGELHKIVALAFRLHKRGLEESDYIDNIAKTCDEYAEPKTTRV